MLEHAAMQNFGAVMIINKWSVSQKHAVRYKKMYVSLCIAHWTVSYSSATVFKGTELISTNTEVKPFFFCWLNLIEVVKRFIQLLGSNWFNTGNMLSELHQKFKNTKKLKFIFYENQQKKNKTYSIATVKWKTNM